MAAKLSFNPYIDGLIGPGSSAGPIDATYAFAKEREQMFTYTEFKEFAWHPFTPAQEQNFRLALAQISNVAQVKWTEVDVSMPHDLVASYVADPSFSGLATGGLPGPSDVKFNTSDVSLPGTFAFHNYLHELLHILGMKHAYLDAGGWWGGGVPEDHLAQLYTTLYSWNQVIGGNTNGYSTVQTLGIDDIRAVQYLHGANFNSNSGATVYKWDPVTGVQFINGVKQHETATITRSSGEVLYTLFAILWDGGGDDTYDLSNFSTNLKIDLRPGNFSTFSEDLLPHDASPNAILPGNIGNAYLYRDPTTGLEDVRSLIENAIGGSGDDLLTGNQANNRLEGRDGDDTLDGGLGVDTMIGGRGDDTYVIDRADDQVRELNGEGRPSALAAVDLVLAMANGEPKGFGPRDEVLRKVLRPVAPAPLPVALGTGT